MQEQCDQLFYKVSPMLHHKSLQSPQYRLVSGLRLVFWILCLTLGGVGLHMAPGASERTQQFTSIEQTDFDYHPAPVNYSAEPKE